MTMQKTSHLSIRIDDLIAVLTLGIQSLDERVVVLGEKVRGVLMFLLFTFRRFVVCWTLIVGLRCLVHGVVWCRCTLTTTYFKFNALTELLGRKLAHTRRWSVQHGVRSHGQDRRTAE